MSPNPVKDEYCFANTALRNKEKARGLVCDSALIQDEKVKAGQALVNTNPGAVVCFHETKGNDMDHSSSAV